MPRRQWAGMHGVPGILKTTRCNPRVPKIGGPAVNAPSFEYAEAVQRRERPPRICLGEESMKTLFRFQKKSARSAYSFERLRILEIDSSVRGLAFCRSVPVDSTTSFSAAFRKNPDITERGSIFRDSDLDRRRKLLQRSWMLSLRMRWAE